MRAPLIPSLVLVALVFAPGGTPSAATRATVEKAAVPTVFRGVDVFDSAAAALIEDRDVWLDALGRIEAVTAPGARASAEGTREIDGAGRTLLPGLIESHAHLLGSGDFTGKSRTPDVQLNLTALLAAGVTTVVDMGSWAQPLLRARAAVEKGRPGPEIYYVGQMITARDGHPAALMKGVLPKNLHGFVDRNLVTQLDGPDDAAAAVAARVEMGAHAVKVALDDLPPGVPQLGDEILLALVASAHAAGLPVWAHVGEPEDVAQALRADVDALVHIPNRGVIPQDLVEELAAKGIPVVSTLHVFRRIDGLAAREPGLSELDRALGSPRSLRNFKVVLPSYEVPDHMVEWIDQNRAGQAAMLDSVRRLVAAGVRVLPGSDTANVGSFLGSGLHHELDHLVEAGMPRLQVLRAATREAALWLDPEADFGAIEPGMQADLILIEGDPSEGFAGLHRPLGVWVDGRRVRPRVKGWTVEP